MFRPAFPSITPTENWARSRRTWARTITGPEVERSVEAVGSAFTAAALTSSIVRGRVDSTGSTSTAGTETLDEQAVSANASATAAIVERLFNTP